jgi:phospholipid transport system substrate-binding protein
MKQSRGRRLIFQNRRRWLVRQTWAAILIAVFAFAPASVSAFAQPGASAHAEQPAAKDPMTQVRTGVADVIAVFRDPAMPLAERRQKLNALADKYFDFDAMARSVMGYHWRNLTPAQRAEFTPLFAGFIKDVYLTKMQDYVVKKVQEELPAVRFNYTHEAFDGADYATVYSDIFLPEQKDPIPVNYLMHRVNGEWRVYDLTVASIDVIANYRNQFNHAMNAEGFDKLIATMREKRQALRRQLAGPDAKPAA